MRKRNIFSPERNISLFEDIHEECLNIPAVSVRMMVGKKLTPVL
jgi:hypothetical protein